MRRGLVLISLTAALTAAGLGLSAVANAEEPACAGLTLGAGQLLDCSAGVLTPGGTATLKIAWSGSCPLNGDEPRNHYWEVVVVLTHGDGTSSGTEYQAPPGSTTWSSEHTFTVGILPAGELRDEISWRVDLHCHNSIQTIRSGVCVLCHAASGEDSAGEALTKCWEGKSKKIRKGKTPECPECVTEPEATRKAICGLPVLKEYDDEGKKKGNCTIGWGHKIHNGPCRCEGAKRCSVKSEKPFFKGITGKDAERLFQRDLARFERFIRDTSPVPLSQCQMNGLADWYFNYGYGPGKRETINADLHSGDFAVVGADMGFVYQKPRPARQIEDAHLVVKTDCSEC
jgi:GH24 family phage-related lysozyme (muramidase)